MRAMRQAQKHNYYDGFSTVANNAVASLIWLATFCLIPSVFQAYGKDGTVRLAWTFSLSHVIIDIFQGIVPLPFLLLIEGVFVGVFFITAGDPDVTEAIKIAQESKAAQESVWSLAFSSPYSSALIFLIEAVHIHKLIFAITKGVLSVVIPSYSTDNAGSGRWDVNYNNDDDDNNTFRKVGVSFIIGLCIVLYGVGGYLLWNAFLVSDKTNIGVVLAVLCIFGIVLSMWARSGSFVAAVLTFMFASLNAFYGAKAMYLAEEQRKNVINSGNKALSMRKLTNLEWAEICEAAIALFVFGINQFESHYGGKDAPRRRRRGSFDGYGVSDTISKEWEQVRQILWQCAVKVCVIAAYTSAVINVRKFGSFDDVEMNLFYTRVAQSFVMAFLLFCRLIYMIFSDYYN